MDLEPLLRFWRAQDDLFDRVEPTWWGAVISDPRYPLVQEPNYARVETRDPVRLEEIERDLVPAMRRAGSRRAHVVVFHPDDQTELVVQASTRGERLAWDLVMEHRGNGLGEPAPGQELGELDARFWAAHRDSMRWFDIVEPDVVEQLQAIERDLFVPAGRRWFAAADDDGIRALAALIVLEGVGYLDHVVTVPGARRRGFASGLTRRAVAAARTSGAERTYLLAEPNGAAARLYADLGFTPIVRLASWISDLAPPP